MHYNQHGFRPGYSWDSALTGVVGQLEYTIIQNQQGIGIFCDLEGAFNEVTYESIMASFKARGFCPFFQRWYLYFLENRFVTIELKGVKLTRKCTRGVPQGGGT